MRRPWQLEFAVNSSNMRLFHPFLPLNPLQPGSMRGERVARLENQIRSSRANCQSFVDFQMVFSDSCSTVTVQVAEGAGFPAKADLIESIRLRPCFRIVEM